MTDNPVTVVYFRARPVGQYVPQKVFETVMEPMPVPKAGELLIASEYLSLDPASRTWMEEGNKDGSNYAPPVGC
jgi:NADPH-dependent curcumin reductase CurA